MMTSPTGAQIRIWAKASPRVSTEPSETSIPTPTAAAPPTAPATVIFASVTSVRLVPIGPYRCRSQISPTMAPTR